MADFNVGINPIASSTPVVQGVTRPSSPLMAGVGDLFSQVAGIGNAKKEEAKQELLSNFTNDQLAITQGVATGQFSAAHGDILLRKGLMDMIQQNPSIRDDLLTSMKGIMGFAGGGDIVKENTEQGQRDEAVKDAMAADGFTDFSPEAVAAYQMQQHTMYRLDQEVKLMGAETTANSLNKSKVEKAARDAIGATANSELIKLNGQYTDIINRMATEGLSPAEVATQINMLDMEYSQKYANMIVDAGDQGAIFQSNLTQLKELALMRASGELDAVGYANRVKALQGIQAVIINSDPTIAQTLSMTQQLAGTGDVGAMIMNQIMIDNGTATKFSALFEGRFTNLASTDAGGAKTNAQVLEAVRAMVTNSDELAEGGDEALATMMATILDGTSDMDAVFAKENGAVAAKELVKFFSTPEFLQLVQDNPQMSDKLQEAALVISQRYTTPIMEMVQDQFTDANIVTQPAQGLGRGGTRPEETAPVTSGISWRVSSSGGISFYSINPNDKMFKGKVEELNKKLAPVINQTVRAQSHLMGKSDYGTYLQESIEQLMSGDNPADNALSDPTQLDYSRNAEISDPNNSPEARAALDSLLSDYPSLIINSGYRDPQHNAAVGGAHGSQHIHGNAFDIDTKGMSQEEIVQLIKDARVKGFKGIGVYEGSVHFDVGGERRWGSDYRSTSFPDWANAAYQ